VTEPERQPAPPVSDPPQRPERAESSPDPARSRGARLAPVLAMALGFVAAAAFLGPSFALALGAFVVWHEVGHRQAARRLGLPATHLLGVPFARRVTAPGALGRTRAEQVEVALAGPLYGLHLCVPLLLLALVLGDGGGLRPLLVLWAGLNLFSLLPVHPFDGGRVVHGLAAAAHPFAGLALSGAGAAALAALALATGDPFLLVFGVLAVLEFLRDYGQFTRWRRVTADPAAAGPPTPADDDLVRLFAGPRVPRGRVAVFLAVWLGLVLFYGALLVVAFYSQRLGAPLGWWSA